jgi:hypothetical protein
MRSAWACASLARSSQYFSSDGIDGTRDVPPVFYQNVRRRFAFQVPDLDFSIVIIRAVAPYDFLPSASLANCS